jgi:hypothetical protein
MHPRWTRSPPQPPGAPQPHAAFFERKPHTCSWLVLRSRSPGNAVQRHQPQQESVVRGPKEMGSPRLIRNGSCSSATSAMYSPCHPRGIMGHRPTRGMKNVCPATTLAGSAALPLVISTGGVMRLRPNQGDENRVLFSNYCCWKRCPPLCHLDRSSEGA